MARLLAAPLAEAAWRGVTMVWQAVRRHLNTEADDIATWAILQARELLRSGRRRTRVAHGVVKQGR
eukprot:9480627-Alexandrium_andersonii.AAC.1